LALGGPGVIAYLASRRPISVASGAPWLGVLLVLTVLVALMARYAEGLAWSDIGKKRVTWSAIPLAVALALFFIFAFGPFAAWVLTELHLGSFDPERASFAALPTRYLSLTVIVVAACEEWLYRAYAIERLEAITGRTWFAASASLLAFVVAHLPLWGPGVALTTVVSGGILTALYVWRRDIAFLILAHILTDLYGLVVTMR
jgi:membrane protease YdiL (CAAX protease family)